MYERCEVKHCDGNGRYMLSLFLFADRRYGKDSLPIRFTFHKAHCEECRDLFLLDRFLTNEVKTGLGKLFAEARNTEVDWRLAELRWEPYRAAEPEEKSILMLPSRGN